MNSKSSRSVLMDTSILMRTHMLSDTPALTGSTAVAKVVAGIVLLLFVEGCWAEAIVARAYDIKNVSEVVVNGGARIQITQGQTESLRVEAASNVIDRVSVDLSGNKLTLTVKSPISAKGIFGKGFNFFDLFKSHNDDALYILQLKNLNHLELSGASHATLSDWDDKNMALNVSGSGEVTFANLKLNDLFIGLSGASNAYIQTLSASEAKFELSGAANVHVKSESETKFLQVGASGASNFHGKLLKVAQADVGASGASNIELHATEMLKASASGASNIRYLGQPKLKSSASGASNVNAMNK